MTKVLVTESHLSDIADAIRAKNGSETEYRPGDMAAAIGGIPAGITPSGTISITQNGTVDVTNYASAAVSVPTGGGGGDISTDFNLSDNLIPKMTGNTAPSGEASASSQINGSFAPYMAFNRSEAASSMQGGWLAASNDQAPWLMYSWGTAQKIDIIEIHTANNSTTYTLTLYIEGLTAGGAWENILASGNTVDVTFVNGTSGNSVGKVAIPVNGGSYAAFRIRGTETFYKGVSATACTFSSVYAYSFSGTLPGVGYYGLGAPSSSLGDNGNIYTDVLSKAVYKKTSGAWAQIA